MPIPHFCKHNAAIQKLGSDFFFHLRLLITYDGVTNSVLVNDVNVASDYIENLAKPLFSHQYRSTNRVVKDFFFFVYLETRTTEETIFDFLKQSMDQLSRNVRLCQKNRTFLSISRDAT